MGYTDVNAKLDVELVTLGSSSPMVKDEFASSRPNFTAKYRSESLNAENRFSRRVIPEVSGMEASTGKDNPNIPLLPVAERPNPFVSFASAGRQRSVP